MNDHNLQNRLRRFISLYLRHRHRACLHQPSVVSIQAVAFTLY